MTEEGPVTVPVTKQRKPIGWILFGILGLCCVAGLAYIFADIRQEAETLGPLEPVCSGQGVSAAAPYPPSGEIAKMVTFQGSGTDWVPHYAGLPTAWDSETVEGASLVLCLGPQEEEVIQVCEYGDEGSEEEETEEVFSVERIRYVREVRLFEAQTGNELLNEKVEGENPERCPTRQSFGGDDVVKLEGEEVESELLQPLLEPFVTEP